MLAAWRALGSSAALRVLTAAATPAAALGGGGAAHQQQQQHHHHHQQLGGVAALARLLLLQQAPWGDKAGLATAAAAAVSPPPPPPQSTRHQSQGPLCAFSFDIDGVLLRGRTPIPGAVEALRLLHDDGSSSDAEAAWRHPVVFLTNGGGMTEQAKAGQLAELLHAPVTAAQCVLSHTPMRGLAAAGGELHGRPVLVVGRGRSAEVAAKMGFGPLVTTAQLAAALPRSALPFCDDGSAAGGGGDGNGDSGGGRAARCPVRDDGLATPGAPLAAVLVLCDPQGRDWYRDLQLTLDAVLGSGVVAAAAALPTTRGGGGQGGRRGGGSGGGGGRDDAAAVVPVIFSHRDLLWATEFPRPRLGQGAFAAALEALHRELRGGAPLPKRVFGKPTLAPFAHAEGLLLQQARALGLVPQPGGFGGATDGGGGGGRFPGIIYHIGDNAAADVAGANAAAGPWRSVLVGTGVAAAATAQGCGTPGSGDAPHAAHADVLAAVKAALCVR